MHTELRLGLAVEVERGRKIGWGTLRMVDVPQYYTRSNAEG